MENFEMWLDELKQGIKENDIAKAEKAETELKNFYGILLMQNEQFKEDIDYLKNEIEGGF